MSPAGTILHSTAHDCGVSQNDGGCTVCASRYRSEMLWFTKEREDRSHRVGLRCGRENGAYVLTVVDADGSETRTTFVDEDAMVAEAVRLQLDLESRGWRALPRTT